MSAKTITFNLSRSSIDKALRDLADYNRWINEKTNELVKALADYGAQQASIHFSGAMYDGNNDVSCHVEENGDGSCLVVATGRATLFIEFGTGIMYAGGHPEETPAVARGSWSMSPQGKGHWDDPNGWYYAHGKKSFGNPANMPMYNAKRDIEAHFEEIARRVFSS